MASLNVPNTARISDLVNEAATKETPEVLQLHSTTPNGLTETEAAERLENSAPTR